jgi:hypothetical protein
MMAGKKKKKAPEPAPQPIDIMPTPVVTGGDQFPAKSPR